MRRAAHHFSLLLLAAVPGLAPADPPPAPGRDVAALGRDPLAQAVAPAADPGAPSPAEPPAAATPLVGSSPAPPPPPGARPDLRPRIYVGDLPQLAEMVRQDPALAARADELQNRRTLAQVLGGTALVSLIVLPALTLVDVSCEPVVMGVRQCSPQPRLAIVGVVGAAVLGGFAMAVAPSRGEVLDLVSRWNIRHPDRQLAPDPWLGAAVGTVPPAASRPPEPATPPPPQ